MDEDEGAGVSAMKGTFPGWYAKAPEELAALWEIAIIVPDANILLTISCATRLASVQGAADGCRLRAQERVTVDSISGWN